MTNSELTARYNELAGKSIKPNTYSKAKLADLIKALDPETAVTPATLASLTGRSAKSIRSWLRRNAEKLNSKMIIGKHKFANAYRDDLVAMITG